MTWLLLTPASQRGDGTVFPGWDLPQWPVLTHVWVKLPKQYLLPEHMWLAKLPLGTSVHSQPRRRNDQPFCCCGLWGPVYSSRRKWQKQLKFVSKQWSPGLAESISSLWVPVQSHPSHLSQGTSGLKESHSQPIANSYFNFFLPPPYMVLGETVKRNTWRAAGRVFLQSPRQAAGKPRVTVLPAWLRPTLHSQNSHLGPHQPRAPAPSSALPWETMSKSLFFHQECFPIFPRIYLSTTILKIPGRHWNG